MATKEEKILQKQIKKAETLQKQQLKDAQKAEIKFLKAEGASKQEINAEKQANKAESANAKSLLSASGFQQLPKTDGVITSQVGTYQDTYAPAVQDRISQAIGLLSEYNIPQSSTKSTDTATIQTGMSLNNAYALAAARNAGLPTDAQSLKDNFGDFITGANRQAKIFNAVDRFATDDVITAADFDKKLKPVKGQENLFTSKIGGGTTGVFQYNPETDSYQYLSATPVKVTEEGGGFLSGIGGQLLVGLAGGLLLGPTASLLATGTTTGAATLGSTIGAGALLGAAGSALTGGNILTGALTGGIGGGAMFGIGQAGGLGNVLRSAGVNLPTNVTNALNSLVSGVGTPSAENAQLAADVLTASGIQTTADDIISSVAREGVEAGFPAGETLLDGIPVGGGFRLTPGQIEASIPTPVGAGTMTIPNVSPGVFGIGFNPNAGGIGLNVNPETFIPTPVGGGTLPPPDLTDLNLNTYMPPPVGAGTIPTVPSPNVSQPSLLDEALNAGRRVVDEVIDYATENPLQAAGLGAAAIGALNQTPVNTGVGNERLPAWVFDPAMSGVIPRIQAAQSSIPAPMPNLFNAQFQRGGLGAGQFIGYDLLNRTGDIPGQTLLGVSPLAMPPMNLLGVTGGQAPTSQAALV